MFLLLTVQVRHVKHALAALCKSSSLVLHLEKIHLYRHRPSEHLTAIPETSGNLNMTMLSCPGHDLLPILLQKEEPLPHLLFPGDAVALIQGICCGHFPPQTP